MGKSATITKYAIIIGGVAMLLFLCVPICSFNILGFDVVSFNGFEFMFGKTVTILGVSERLSGNTVGFCLLLPPLGLIGLTIFTEDADNESRGVFAIVLSILYAGIFWILINSVKSSIGDSLLGYSFCAGLWLAVIISIIVLCLGLYALFLGLKNNHYSEV